MLYKVLEKQYTYNANDSKNMIAPLPYNTSNKGWVYNNVNDPKIKKWLDEVVRKEGKDLSRHDKVMYDISPVETAPKVIQTETEWQAQAGSNYRYFMVFKDKDLSFDGRTAFWMLSKICRGGTYGKQKWSNLHTD